MGFELLCGTEQHNHATPLRWRGQTHMRNYPISPGHAIVIAIAIAIARDSTYGSMIVVQALRVTRPQQAGRMCGTPPISTTTKAISETHKTPQRPPRRADEHLPTKSQRAHTNLAQVQIDWQRS